MEEIPFSPILDLLHGFRKSQVLFASIELKIFDTLLDLNDSASLLQLSQKLQLEQSQDGLERLLNSCVAVDLLKKSPNGEYSLTPSSKMYLTQSSPHSLVGYVLHSKDVLYKLWGGLPSSVKSGKPCWEETFNLDSKEIFQALYKSDQDLKRFMNGMHSFSVLSGDAIASAFDLSKFHNVVDLGGATGALVSAMCRKYPTMNTFIFELASVVQHAHEYIDKLETDIRSRIHLKEGDFFVDPLPKADLFLISRILHDWSEDKIKVLLKKIFSALPNNGGLLIAEMVLEEDKTLPLHATLQSLNMLVQTEGKERSFSEYSSLLKEAGFHTVQLKKTDKYLDAILALKEVN